MLRTCVGLPLPIGAPTASAANMAMPLQDIDMSARCDPTEAIERDMFDWPSSEESRGPANARQVTLSAGPGSELGNKQESLDQWSRRIGPEPQKYR